MTIGKISYLKKANYLSEDFSISYQSIHYFLVFTINGYEIDFDIKSEISDDFNELILILWIGVNTERGGCEFKVYDSLSVFVRSCLEEVLTDFVTHYDYLEYWNTNLSLRFDFSYLEDSMFKLMFF